MVSYADFITLLFVFFLVMYAVTSVSEDKYREMSESVRTNLGISISDRPVEVDATSIIELQSMNSVGDSIIDMSSGSPEESFSEDDVANVPGPGEAAIELISDKLDKVLSEVIHEGKVAIRRSPRGLEVEINSQLLFDSASSVINETYRPVLVEIAGVLRGQYNAVDVEGFTDDLPIYTERYPSNWELSAARAAAVIRLFVDSGIEPVRLAAVGYGPYQPIADNDTEFGRAKNRRVVLVIRNQDRRLPNALTIGRQL